MHSNKNNSSYSFAVSGQCCVQGGRFGHLLINVGHEMATRQTNACNDWPFVFVFRGLKVQYLT